MALNIVWIVIGLIALFYGAEWLVKGASRLAASFGVTPLVIGLTLVAFSTSAPELLVSVTAALRGSSDLSLGNVVGSNIANIGLILGLTAIIFPIAVHSRVLRREIPIMLAASLAAYLMALDGQIGLVDGVLLFLGLIAFNVAAYLLAERAQETDDVAVAEFAEYEELEGVVPGMAVNRLLELGRVAVGVAFLLVGAQLLVDGATAIARALGISELVIGITLVAFGTSLPELATSMVSAFRNEDDISVGNIIGSNIYNLLAVLGITAIVRPINVAASVLRLELPVMLAFSILLWPLVRNSALERWKGALLTLGYLLFVLSLFV